tara:strand:+ start:265 stop:558 length:294 start_codon:yes stop_codon:yes gene_type:complete
MTKIQINNTVRDMTAEEQAAYDARQVTPLSALNQSLSDLREDRNRLLQECDWIELNNAPLTSNKKTEWQTYRTKLRDITNGLDTVDKVKAVTWPTKP